MSADLLDGQAGPPQAAGCQAKSKTEPPGRQTIHRATHLGLSLFRSRRRGLWLGSQSPVAFYGAAMAPDLKHPATGDLIVLAGGEQLWRIGWPGAPVLVVTKNGPDGNALYRLADPKCKTWNKVGDMKLVPWPEAGS